jgi:hypothetical protein
MYYQRLKALPTNWVNLNRLKRIGLNNNLLLLLVITTKQYERFSENRDNKTNSCSY